MGGKTYWVYIVGGHRNGALYVGVTGDLAARMEQHRWGEGSTYAWHHGAIRLVHVEAFDNPEQAILREKRLKRWRRSWKLDLIDQHNPDWRDLYLDLPT